jgi:hypothetical protein
MEGSMGKIRALVMAIGCIVPLLVGSSPGFAQARDVCDVVYWDANFGGESMRSQGDISYVGNHWNDQISSIRVLSGFWEFYWDADYRGEVLRLGPGNYPYVGDHWNDQISSFRCSRR